MRTPRWRPAVLTAACALMPLLAGARADTPRLDQVAATDLRDLEATIRVEKADQAEMAKISRDFGMAYRLLARLRDVTFQYKSPDMVRIASRNRVGVMVCNGSTLFYSLGGIKSTEKDAPASKRHSLLDLGVLSTPAVASLRGRFVRTETLDGAQVQVFEVAYRGDDSARYVVWVNPVTHVVVKRTWYDREGKLRATFLYKDTLEALPGVWVPTRVQAINTAGVVACETTYSDVRVNQGLADTLFDVS